MEKNTHIQLPELLFATSDKTLNKQMAKLEKQGNIKKLMPRVYTSNFSDTHEALVRRNLFTILGALYPGAVLSHRSALEFAPTAEGQLFLTYTYTKKVRIPGIELRIQAGSPAIEGDNPIAPGLYVSQLERALLENLQANKGKLTKLSTPAVLEERLEQVLQVHGEAALNTLRDKCRVMSQVLGMQVEFEKLNRLIAALLASHPSKLLQSPMARARALGVPYDAGRILLFEKLCGALLSMQFPDFQERFADSNEMFEHFAFFEAYFSNYIEGTEFELDDAMQIIRSQTPMPLRTEDSHDVLGTYQIVSNRADMAQIPKTGQELLDLLLLRHSILLRSRTSKQPGQFKDINNRAGDTVFVDYKLVRGTLMRGFDLMQAITQPFARAAYMMFLVSEVHPFLDGNGRVARVMMNAELVAVKQSKIIIPTVYREDYILALRRLTRQGDPGAYIRMLQRAHTFSHALKADSFPALRVLLEKSNAFKRHDEALLRTPEVD